MRGIFFMRTCCVKSILTYNMLYEKYGLIRRCGRVAVLTASIVLTLYGKSPFPVCRAGTARFGQDHHTRETPRSPVYGCLDCFFPWTADVDVGCREPDIMQPFNKNPSPSNGVATPYGK
jgi:hypothetical protein